MIMGETTDTLTTKAIARSRPRWRPVVPTTRRILRRPAQDPSITAATRRTPTPSSRQVESSSRTPHKTTPATCRRRRPVPRLPARPRWEEKLRRTQQWEERLHHIHHHLPAHLISLARLDLLPLVLHRVGTTLQNM